MTLQFAPNHPAATRTRRECSCVGDPHALRDFQFQLSPLPVTLTSIWSQTTSCTSHKTLFINFGFFFAFCSTTTGALWTWRAGEQEHGWWLGVTRINSLPICFTLPSIGGNIFSLSWVAGFFAIYRRRKNETSITMHTYCWAANLRIDPHLSNTTQVKPTEASDVIV